MAYKLIVKPEADFEMFEAINWYVDKDMNLGLRFASELKSTLHYIKLQPENFQKKYRNIRICFTKTFPYGIHYIIEENTIYVLAILHTSRNPRK
jgi:hypothetical protein